MAGSNRHKRIIFGTMTLGPEGKSGARTYTVDGAKEILTTFASHGYDEIDTARVYCEGETERYLKEVGWKTEFGFTLATKVYPMKGDEHDPANLRALLETSISTLGDTPDIFYLHAPCWGKDFEPTLAEIDKLHREGKFKTFALSNFTAWQVAEVSILCREKGWVRPTLYQGMYNAITRAIEPELVVACRKYSLDIVVYNPIAGGLLTNRVFTIDTIPDDGRFGSGRQGDMYRQRYFREGTFSALEMVRRASDESGIPVVDIALRWLLHHSALNIRGVKPSGNDGIILGASSNDQLQANLKALEGGPLPQNILDTLDKAWLAVKATSPNYWHGQASATYIV
ncbi:hypothetical protein PYCC9005_003119 [Savitreella phatthalungensis]